MQNPQHHATDIITETARGTDPDTTTVLLSMRIRNMMIDIDTSADTIVTMIVMRRDIVRNGKEVKHL